ncbi:hypothetical protein J3Q64DRAFT_1608979, partial [Phycomyces blakesleeanus]
RKKQRVLAADIQWCINNKDTITLKSFTENFGLLDKQYTVSRYTSIINSRHLAVDQKRLQSELDLSKKSEKFKLYWMERTRKLTQLDVDVKCTEYVHDAAERATRALSSFSAANDTTKTTKVESTVDTSATETVAATATILEDVETPAQLIPWIFKGVDVAELFTKF